MEETPAPSKMTLPWKPAPENRTCFKCGKLTQSRRALHVHLNRVYPCDLKGPESCFKCDKTFPTLAGLHLHLAKGVPCDASTTGHKCEKCQQTFASAQTLRSHQSKVITCDGPPSPAPVRGCKTCPKCHKTFTTTQGLRFHLNRVIPCNADIPTKSETPGKKQATGEETKGHPCPRCQRRFPTRQGVRIHLGRKKCFPASQLTKTLSAEEALEETPEVVQRPEEQERLKTNREVLKQLGNKQATREETKGHPCPRCKRRFTTEQGVRIHLGRKKCFPASHLTKTASAEALEQTPEVVQRPEEQERLKTNREVLKQVGSSGSSKGADTGSQAAKVDEQADMSDIRGNSAANNEGVTSSGESTHSNGSGKAGQFKELVERLPLKQSHPSDQTTAVRTAALNTTLKRSRDRSNEDLSPVEKTGKRPCHDTGPLADVVGRVLEGSPGERVEKHGGNIMTDGCCCRACVRKWTYKMTLRLEQLRDEVESLRGIISTTTDDSSPSPTEKISQTPRPNAHSTQVDSTSTTLLKAAEPKQDNRSADLSCSGSNSPEKVNLTENYNHLNDQIITNERALEDSIAYLKKISDHDGESSTELSNQIDELRVYIDAAKGKRDEAVAAIVTHRWKSNRIEFQLLLETMAATSKPDVEKIFHEECAEIASQLAEDEDEVLSKGVVESNHGGVPAYDVQKIAKQLLERERDELFVRLLRSSRRIYFLTKAAFN